MRRQIRQHCFINNEFPWPFDDPLVSSVVIVTNDQTFDHQLPAGGMGVSLFKLYKPRMQRFGQHIAHNAAA
jgi:hypothetical protein